VPLLTLACTFCVIESCDRPFGIFGWTGYFPKLACSGSHLVKKSCRYLCSFWYNTGVWQTDRQTDGHLCYGYTSACIGLYSLLCHRGGKKKDVVRLAQIQLCIRIIPSSTWLLHVRIAASPHNRTLVSRLSRFITSPNGHFWTTWCFIGRPLYISAGGHHADWA